MATQPLLAAKGTLTLQPVCTFPQIRGLAWDGDVLYASLRYTLYSARLSAPEIHWHKVATHKPQWWRRFTSGNSLASRLVRDGFHTLAVLSNGNLVAAVPGAVISLRHGESVFEITHHIKRGTRPLQICRVPTGLVFWGEYFDNRRRSEVHVYGSSDGGLSWQIVYTFPARCIRHVHNIVYDQWQNCLWILTGDYGQECRILRASLDFKSVDEVIAGDQQARAVAAVPTHEGLYFASDTPLEQNYIYCLGPAGSVRRLCRIPSSAIAGCRNAHGLFFSTMVEPSEMNRTKHSTVYGSAGGGNWRCLAEWKKDRLPMRLFQYGTTFFPSGNNDSDLLAVSTIGLSDRHLQTIIFRVSAD